jgi:GT2 family glycosyltransferase
MSKRSWRGLLSLSPSARERPRVRGRLEGLVGTAAHGWAMDRATPNRRVKLDVLLGETVVARGVADRYRKDLLDAGMGDGRHGFSIDLPPEYFDGKPCDIAVRDTLTGLVIPEPLVGKMLPPQPPGGFLLKGRQARAAINGMGASPDQTEMANPSSSGDAVQNGSFLKWSAPFRQQLANRRLVAADDWQVEATRQSPSVVVWLADVLIRDPTAGNRDGGELGYGLALLGTVSGTLRVYSALDKHVLSDGLSNNLEFFALPASALQSSPFKTGEAGPVINKITVVEQAAQADDPSDSELVCVIAGKQTLRSHGTRFSIRLDAAKRDRLRDRARALLEHPNSNLLLVFEFKSRADCVLASVSLTAAQDSPPQTERPLGLEDQNIAIQLPILRGLDHWSSTEVLHAPSARLGEGSQLPAKWSWPSGRCRSVEIIICVHNAIEDTLDCLRSLKECTRVPHTVTIVDDCSSPLTRERLRFYCSEAPWMRLVRLESRAGYTRAANHGLSKATAEWLVLLNSDTVLTTGWLEGLLEVVDANPEVAFVGPLSNAASWQSVPEVKSASGGWAVNSIPEGMSVQSFAEMVAGLSLQKFPTVPLLNGFCTMMRRDVIEELGFLDEVSFPVGYGEETDLCIRAQKAGYAMAVADHVYVHHVKSASFGSRTRGSLAREGQKRLLDKHPDVDIPALERELAETRPLIELRRRIREELSIRRTRQVG